MKSFNQWDKQYSEFETKQRIRIRESRLALMLIRRHGLGGAPSLLCCFALQGSTKTGTGVGCHHSPWPTISFKDAMHGNSKYNLHEITQVTENFTE